MSTPADEPPTKAAQVRERLKNNTGPCFCGSCTCELFESVGMRDGFLTCVCTHTQWSHTRVTVSS